MMQTGDSCSGAFVQGHGMYTFPAAPAGCAREEWNISYVPPGAGKSVSSNTIGANPFTTPDLSNFLLLLQELNRKSVKPLVTYSDRENELVFPAVALHCVQAHTSPFLTTFASQYYDMLLADLKLRSPHVSLIDT